MIFGAALLYDETVDSFKWLFETFLSTHNPKHPRTIFIDQDIAMGKAIGEVFVDATHGLCTWHMSQNAINHLSSYRNDGPSILKDLKLCMYQYEREVHFEEVFKLMQSKVKQGSWLDGIHRGGGIHWRTPLPNLGELQPGASICVVEEVPGGEKQKGTATTLRG